MPGAGRIHDPALLDGLEAIEPTPFAGAAWRVSWASRDPPLGSEAGGRWHPPGSFPALYVSLEADGALAEVYHHLSRAPVFASSAVRLHRLAVATARTLDLGAMPTLAGLGIDEARYRSLDWLRSQEIGAAAHMLDCDGMLVPSARWDCLNLVVFLDRLDADEALTVEESSEVNWPAWRERRGRPKGPG